MIRAGDLDRRISVQRATFTIDPEYGEEVPTWETIATVSAAVKQISGREFLAGNAEVNEQRAVFFIRWMPGVTVLDRVVYLGAPFDIDDVREVGRHEGLELHARLVR